MSTVIADDKDLRLNFGSLMPKFSDEQYEEFCRQNPDLLIERSAEGDIIIVSPTGGESGNRNFYLTGQFSVWVAKNGTGKGFDSSTEFRLPNGAMRMPDVSWVRNERWHALSQSDRRRFPPLCPDFVIELRSATDRLKKLQQKMEEYLSNGAELGWLIDPLERKIHVYRPGAAVAILDDPKEISGEPLLNGFILDVQALWAAGE
jgi:Uma2 family endonuclease